MKKTLFILLATCNFCIATAEAVESYELPGYNISFGENETLTEKKQAMTWADDVKYDNWFITFSLDVNITENTSDYFATITTGEGTGGSNGLSASAKEGEITLGYGNRNTYKGEGVPSLSFSDGDTLTFAFYNDTAYLGNQTTQQYISYTTTNWNTTTNIMTPGGSYAWSNGSTTKIGKSAIASLDGYIDQNLDMAVLMTTGAVKIKSDEEEGNDTPSTPTVTSNYYVHQSGNTTAWTDKVSFSLGTAATVNPTDSLPTYFKYYNGKTDAEANRDRKLVLALGDSSKEDGCVDLGNVQISNGVIKYPEVGGVAKKPNEDGGSGYAPDDANASPLTYSYGILELAEDSYVKLSETPISGSDTQDMQNITSGWAYVGSLQLKENARLSLENRSLAVTGQPYTSLGTGARIDILKGGVISFGASNEGTWDAIVLTGADDKTGTIINTSDHTAELGTSSAKDVEFRDVVLTTQGDSNITIAAKLGGAHVYANSSSGTTATVTFTGGVADGYDKAIKQLRTGDNTDRCGKAKVYLHNRGESVIFDSLIISQNHTVGVRQGDENSEVSTVSIAAYNPDLAKEGFNEIIWEVNSFHSYRYSELEANLSLGVGEMTQGQQCVAFNPALEVQAYDQTDDRTDRTEGYGLNMLNNHVELVGNIVLSAYYTQYMIPEGDSEMLLFYNVASLTLIDTVYDENNEINYFDYTAGIAASTVFSTTAENPFYYSSFDEPTEENGSLTGWFIEYRDNGEQNGTGDVYLVYRAPKKMDSVPEPATGTLSLLALAALAARRRRR